jgi:AraC-like DNA-binding protein
MVTGAVCGNLPVRSPRIRCVNCRCTTAPFTVSPEPGASLRCANLPGDSALYDVPVRRLTALHSGFLQTDSRETALEGRVKLNQNDFKLMDYRTEYISRINRVIDYIESNLAEELQLETLARVAAFSTFHFHRIFRAATGEPLYGFIQRLRLEKAAGQLINNPTKTITEIAFDCGFGLSATFSRAFRNYFNVSPSQWRKTSFIKSKIGKDEHIISKYIRQKASDDLKRFAVTDTDPQLQIPEVKIKTLSSMTLAYVRYIGPFIGNPDLYRKLSKKLKEWARNQNLVPSPDRGNPNIRATSRKSSLDGEPSFHIQFEASIRIDVLSHQWT